MSQLLHNPSNASIIVMDDKRCMGEAYRQDVELSWYSSGDTQIGDYSSPWWPGSGLSDDGEGICGSLIEAQAWGYFEQVGGTTSRYGIVGVTRGVYGSPLGGATVKLFRTSTDELVATIVSDPVGGYTITTPYYPDAHYLVVYKAGTPDVMGTTVNTLIGG